MLCFIIMPLYKNLKFIIAKQQDSDRKPYEKYMKMMQMRQKMWESVWMKNKEMRY